jgi:predicted permease
MRTWWAKLRYWLRGEEEREAELREEMAAYLAFAVEDGATAAEARRRFGNAASIAERTREAWTVRWLAGFARDVRFAMRSLRRRPAFAAVAVLSLGIALGANAAVFSFVNAIVLKILPVAGANRLVIVRQKNEQFHIENCCFGYRFYRELRRQSRDFEDWMALSSIETELGSRGETERVRAELVSGNYFRMLGVRPAVGRLLDDADDAVEGASPVCVIGYRLWQDRFGGDPGVVGRQVSLGGEPFQIVGVSERGFAGASLHMPRDLQVPSAMMKALTGWGRDEMSVVLVGRLKPKVKPAQALARLNVQGKSIEQSEGRKIGPHDDFLMLDGSQGVNSDQPSLGKPVLVLFLLVGVLLVVACANVGALLLVRSVERTREAGMRLAIGASRAVLFRQFLTEAVLLALAGGVAGWGIGLALVRVLLTLLPQEDTLRSLIHLDGMAAAFAAAAALAAGVLFGLLPAWRASRAEPLPAIQGTVLARPGRRPLLAGGAIAAQIALSLALVFCAGLFARTLHNLRAVDLGFRPESLLTQQVDLARTTYEKQGGAWFGDLLRRARELPEVRAASLCNLNTLTGSMSMVVIGVPGYVSPNGLRPTTYTITTSGGYFRTLGTPLVEGRDFNENDGDGRNGEGSAIVNEAFARQFFRGDALGKGFSYASGRKVRVVGVARTAKFQEIREDPKPVMFLPFPPGRYASGLFLQVRATGGAERAAERLHMLVHDLAPGLTVPPPVTMESQIDAALSRERLLAFLSTLLGGVAAALAAIGLYGVLSFAVTRRTCEIGIRMSVGAQRAGIVGLFLRESAWMVAAGIAAGIPLMLVCGRLAATLLYGLKGADARVLAGAVAGLALVAAAAAAIPAARAACVDPIRALRHE